MGLPQTGWFIMEIPIKMDDSGVSLFQETSMSFCSVKCIPQKMHFVSSVSGIPCRRVCLRVQRGEA